MSDVYVYQVKLPKGINEMVIPGIENDYTVYIDIDLPPDKQMAAYRHAIKHCERNDFGKDNVQEIETDAHKEE
jgi:hypothetical protein